MAGVGRVSWQRVVIGALAVAVVAVVLMAIRRDPPAPPVGSAAPLVSPSPTMSLPPGVDAVPDPESEDRLPRQVSVLPEEIALGSVGVPSLSESPVRRAYALVEVHGADELVGQVFVVGDDGGLRSLDVVHLSQVEDRDGNRRSPFQSTVLRADGAVAAFPQRDRVALINLTTATVRWVSVPGFNEHLVWRGDELVVSQASATFLVDMKSGRVRRGMEPGFSVAAASEGGAAVVELPSDGRPLLRVESGGRRVNREVRGLPAATEWVPPARLSGHLMAINAVMADTANAEPVMGVAVVDVETAHTVRLLWAPYRARYAVVGWLDHASVLIHTPTTGRLLAWDITTGEVRRVTRLSSPAGSISVSLADLTR